MAAMASASVRLGWGFHPQGSTASETPVGLLFWVWARRVSLCPVEVTEQPLTARRP